MTDALRFTLIASVLLVARAAFASGPTTTYDVVSKNVGSRNGTFARTGTSCAVIIERDPRFKIDTPPIYPIEFKLSVSRPAGWTYIAMVAPEFDPSQTRWSIDTDGARIEYRDPFEAQLHTIFRYDPETGALVAAELPENGESCLLTDQR